jgi:hypothetical protein
MNLTDIHNLYGNYILAVLRSHGVLQDDLEDLRQDVYLKLLKTKRRVKNTPENIKRFLRIVCVTTAADYRKHRALVSMETISVLDSDGFEAACPEVESQIFQMWESASGSMSADRIEEALDHASGWLVCVSTKTGVLYMLEVLDLLIQGYTLKQVTGQLGYTQSFIKNSLHQWRRQIKKGS